MSLIKWLLLAVLLKCLVWWVIVPMWQAPDEQSHFAELNYIVEMNDWIGRGEKDLSREILVSEEFLGTKRDAFGNNKFTYHPEYKIEYTDNLKGKYEGTINLLGFPTRAEMVGRESAGYPPAFYFLTTPVYSLVYGSGLIERVFAVRLVSLALNVLLVLIAYFIGLVVWKNRGMGAALGMLVGFQPMVSFVASGYHPDNLLNLIASLAILVCLLVLRDGARWWHLAALGILGILGLETKQFMVFLLPVIIAVVVYELFKKKPIGIILGLLVLAAPVAGFVLLLPIPYMPKVTALSPLTSMNIVDYLKFRIPKLMFEMWPWFWGVFKWLGVVLPPLVLKIITRVGVLAGIGVGIKMLIMVKRKKIIFEDKALIFFLTAIFSYLLYMFFWDWRLMQSNGFSLGLQGRYLFPNIIPEMAIILMGLLSFIPERLKTGRRILLTGLITGAVVLNGVALYTVARSYYDVSSWGTFLIQVAQYKPEIVKQVIGLLL